MSLQQYHKMLSERENSLSVLANRLRTATYEDDKMDALSEIAGFSACAAVAVGAICLKDIFCSIPHMDASSLHFIILQNVTECRCRNEFIDMVANDPECMDAFFNMSIHECAKSIDILGFSSFYKSIGTDPRGANVILELVKKGYHSQAIPIINSVPILKETLVKLGIFNGAFTLLSNYRKESQNHPLIEPMLGLICAVLYCSHLASTSFMNSRFHEHELIVTDPSAKLASKIFPLLLEQHPHTETQRELFIPSIVGSLVAVKNYTLLYKMVSGKLDLVQRLFNSYIDPLVLSKDTEQLHCAIPLFSLWIKLKGPGGIAVSGYNSALILLEYGLETTVDTLLSDIQKKELSRSMLLYMAASCNQMDETLDLIRSKDLRNCSEDILAMVILLFKIHGAHGGVDEMSILKKFREKLCREPIIDAYYTEMLISLITDTIKPDIPIVEELLSSEINSLDQDYDNYRDDSSCSNKEQTSTTKSVLEGVLNRFKPKKHETYDL